MADQSIIYGGFVLRFPHTFKDFINIHEYANKLICITGHKMKGLCISFNLVPSVVVYDKYILAGTPPFLRMAL